MRIAIQKTLKMYVGGRFIRSESGRLVPTTSARGDTMYCCQASRKDLRNTVLSARAAQAGWAGRTAYNRGQILYRLAEMLDDRVSSLPTTKADAQAAADRAVHHAGWTDKIGAVLSSVNPVGSGHVNYSMVRGMGVVVALPDPADGLLGMVEATCASIVMCNSVIVLVPTERAELATAFAEALATSDMPAGVVNILTGELGGVLAWADKHDDIDAIYVAGSAVTAEQLTSSQASAARVLRRIITTGGASTAAPPSLLERLAETKTVWMSS